MVVGAVGSALLRHGATNACAVYFRFDVVADIDGALAHDVSPRQI